MMKNKIKKYKLSFESDYHLFGIQTDAPGHKFIYFINKDLKIKFIRDKDLELLNYNQSVYLPKFVYNDFKRDQDWILISNRSEYVSNFGEDYNEIFHEKLINYLHLIPEYKMFNYILKIENFNDSKPYIIMSHSQGALHAQRLISMYIQDTDLQKRMICAYVI